MAAGAFISALANLPWGQVVDNAPKLAEGAARLMRAVSRWRKPSAPDAEPGSPSSKAPPADIQTLTREIKLLQDTVTDLQEQMQVSSQLLKDLTDQNIQLIQRVELHRVRLWWVGMTSVGVLLTALAVTAYLLTHST